jgi:hypothetical protein
MACTVAARRAKSASESPSCGLARSPRTTCMRGARRASLPRRRTTFHGSQCRCTQAPCAVRVPEQMVLQRPHQPRPPRVLVAGTHVAMHHHLREDIQQAPQQERTQVPCPPHPRKHPSANQCVQPPPPRRTGAASQKDVGRRRRERGRLSAWPDGRIERTLVRPVHRWVGTNRVSAAPSTIILAVGGRPHTRPRRRHRRIAARKAQVALERLDRRCQRRDRRMLKQLLTPQR